MDRKLNRRIADYVGDFKKQIKEKALELRFTDTEKLQELMEFVFQYNRLVLSKEDVSKRKRVKNSIPSNNRVTQNEPMVNNVHENKRKASCIVVLILKAFLMVLSLEIPAMDRSTLMAKSLPKKSMELCTI